MYYLKDSLGNTVRAIQWSDETLFLILRHDHNRIESCSNLKPYDDNGIGYTVLETLKKSEFDKKATPTQLKNVKHHLTLVKDSGVLLEDPTLQEDDVEKFNSLLKKTAVTGAASGLIIIILSLLFKPQAQVKEPLQVVQVMDRQQIEKSIVSPSIRKVSAPVAPVAVKKTAKKIVARQSGVLSVLGSLQKSKQVGGLKLENAAASQGIGRGGTEGSGGTQTSVYAKGLFSAPLGTGGKVNGAGGYGTKGKGGGSAGYGKIQLVGQGGQSYFQPIENEALVGGGLDRNEIAAVIQRHLSEVRYCYEQGLQNKPRLAGRLAIKFLIGPKGIVTLAQIDHSSLGHAPVEGCIRDRLKTWNFPKPEGGVTVRVTYPFILKRVSDT